LDDATSSVDASMEEDIRDALGEVMRGRTTLIIAHRLATIALADRVIFMERGRVVAEGTHEQLLETVPEYVEVLMQQEAAGRALRAAEMARQAGLAAGDGDGADEGALVGGDGRRHG